MTTTTNRFDTGPLHTPSDAAGSPSRGLLSEPLFESPLTITDQRAVPAAKPFVDLIWNVTALCVWNCGVCCVDAAHVRRVGDVIEIATDSLTNIERIPYRRDGRTIFEQAQAHHQNVGLELTLEQKLQVIENLRGYTVKTDVSGGDALVVGDTPIVLAKLADTFGRENVTLTATGAGTHGYGADELRPLIGEFNFTYDGEPVEGSETRPRAYARGNLRKARVLATAGIATRGEVPLTMENVEPKRLQAIYLEMHAAGIDKLLAMRLFNVGRGTNLAHQTPTAADYRRAIATLRELEARYSTPVVKLQCALRRLDPDFDKFGENPCDALTESLGLTATGTLMISPWAVNQHGGPLHKSWVLGNLAKAPLADLLGTQRVERMRSRAGENHGACKIFAWQNSKLGKDDEGRFFDESDPLYG